MSTRIFTGQMFKAISGATLKITGPARGGYSVSIDGKAAGCINRDKLLAQLADGRVTYAGYERPVKRSFTVLGCAQ